MVIPASDFTKVTAKDKNKLTDRIVILKVSEGLKPTNSSGAVDPRLYQGGNSLHIVADTTTMLWYFKLDHGILPQPLQQRFTSFKKALEHARDYYAKRNVEIEKVIE